MGDGTGEAVAAKGITVDGDMQCNRGFAAHGSVNLRAARITGRVLVAKQRHRRPTLQLPGRLFSRLLDWGVGYGYRPWLAALWLAALLAVGTAVFAVRQPHLIPGGPTPPFNSFVYTLDLLIPIGAFGLRNSYASTGADQWLADALIAAGWILATAVIAGITRAVRRD